ncbi:MAG: His-Xaa-Ser system radical SAM maturase HxsC [Verrucomicrobiota bacterium]
MISLWDTVEWLTPPPNDVILARVDATGLLKSSLSQVLLGTLENVAALFSGEISPRRYAAVILAGPKHRDHDWSILGIPVGQISEQSSHLSHLDIIRIDQSTNRARVLFKRSFRHNSLLITERCNNYCVMCSQPPRQVDDSWIADELFRVIELIPKDTREIGITGGEPTLLGETLLQLIRHIKNQLPVTALHILSNGRRFSDAEFAAECGRIGHPDLMFGIPIYSDNYIDHDYVVQAQGGFSEAVAGIANLKRNGVRIEIRCVIHRDTWSRLSNLATFITRNLTYVDHVAFMGYEAMGFGKTNARHLFVLPEVFLAELAAAVSILETARIRTSVYNLPFCLLEEKTRALAVQSISDWKNEYLPDCGPCADRLRCTGFFTSTKEHYRGHVRPSITNH